MEYYRERMFKNTHKWRWEGYAHEYPTSDTHKTKVELKGVSFRLFPKINNNHIKRNYDLLIQQCEDKKDTGRTWFYLGQSSKDLGNYNEAINSYAKCIHSTTWNEEKFYALYDTGKIYHKLLKYEKAKEYYLAAFEVMPTRGESLYNLALILRYENKHGSALLYLKHIRDMKKPESGLFMESSVYDYLVYFELAISYYWIGNYEKSFWFTKEVIKISEYCSVPKNFLYQNKLNMEFAKNKLNIKKDA
jgi:tetratricopeptide (TPR) repeat protein